MFVNCVVWTAYGMLVDANYTIIVPNTLGLMCATYCMYVYTHNAPDSSSTHPIYWALGLLVCLGLVLLLMQTTSLVPYSVSSLVGSIGAILSITFAASPLAGIKEVLQGNASAMPWHTSLATFVCVSLWAQYGLVIQDSNVSTPNVFAMGVSALQLVLLLRLKVIGNKTKA